MYTVQDPRVAVTGHSYTCETSVCIHMLQYCIKLTELRIVCIYICS